MNAAQGISDLINERGQINLDFADVNTVMRGMGDALMGSGTASGEERAVLAAQQAICSPLLEAQSIRGARGAIVSIRGGENMTLDELGAATEIIYEEAGKDVNLNFGYVVDPSMKDELKVTVIVTGFDSRPIEQTNDSRDVMDRNYNRESEEIMDAMHTPLHEEQNAGPVSSTLNEEDNESENIDDAPTLVFGEFNQDNKLEIESDSESDEVPAFIRRQNQ